ncbi:hypothetical protein OROHE_015936 [Orobanche hederae]
MVLLLHHGSSSSWSPTLLTPLYFGVYVAFLITLAPSAVCWIFGVVGNQGRNSKKKKSKV